ncbi:MAG: hypothetical protein H0V30_12335 [Chitinophagaceae bacterium]|jgi:fatty acid desaturase|nr:hypothetical protein [Chitinophagaceae bacterium]
MRKISYWARRHIMLTRLLIGLLYIVINLLGLFLGDLLFSADIILTILFIYLPIGLLFTGVLIYPSKERKNSYKNFYRQQKTADLLLAVSTFLFIVYGGNSINRTSYNSFSGAYAITFSHAPPTSVASTAIAHPDASADKMIKKPLSKKELRKNLKSKWKEFRKQYKESTKGEKAALIILSIIIAVGLVYLMAALSCGIACSGSEGLAIVVGILGTGLIIFLLVRVIQRINRGPRVKTDPVEGT